MNLFDHKKGNYKMGMIIAEDSESKILKGYEDNIKTALASLKQISDLGITFKHLCSLDALNMTNEVVMVSMRKNRLDSAIEHQRFWNALKWINKNKEHRRLKDHLEHISSLAYVELFCDPHAKIRLYEGYEQVLSNDNVFIGGLMIETSAVQAKYISAAKLDPQILEMSIQDFTRSDKLSPELKDSLGNGYIRYVIWPENDLYLSGISASYQYREIFEYLLESLRGPSKAPVLSFAM